MEHTISVAWNKLDEAIESLATDDVHKIEVQREAIPLVFVPGIMGSRLRLAGTNGKGKNSEGLPNLRWDPGDGLWMYKNFTNEGPVHRKRMLVGETFSPSFLEVDDSTPVGDGFSGIMKDYRPFLETLRNNDWKALSKVFEFPVYAFGYNWTANNDDAGMKLARRIIDIRDEARAVTGACDKVIVITHSMGGMVARAASELHQASDAILGVIHGVQPVTGAAAAYWRIKAGFEGYGPTSATLGNSGPNVACVLGNMPGGLQLLPNKHHRTNAGGQQWLSVVYEGKTLLALPNVNPAGDPDPYNDIYRIPAVPQPTDKNAVPSGNAFWGLVDPALLDPGPKSASPNENDELDNAASAGGPEAAFGALLKQAEQFHDKLKLQAHKRTFTFHGTGGKSADVVTLTVASDWNMTARNCYPKRGFTGYFRSADGKHWKAVLENPAGDGDGTVPTASGDALVRNKIPVLDHQDFKIEHQPAFEKKPPQAFTINSIKALCKIHYESKR